MKKQIIPETLYLITLNDESMHIYHNTLEEAEKRKAELLNPENYFNFIGEKVEIVSFTKN